MVTRVGRGQTVASSHDSDRRSLKEFHDAFAFHSLVGAAVCELRLLHVDKAEKLCNKAVRRASDRATRMSVFEGYKMAAVICSYFPYDVAIDNPEFLGVTSLPGVSEMYHWNEVGFAIPEGDTRHEALIRSFWWLRSELISARNWEELRLSAGRVLEFISAFRRVVSEHYQIRIGGSRRLTPVDSIADLVGLDLLATRLHDLGNVRMARGEVYRSGSSGRNEEAQYERESDRRDESGRERGVLLGYELALLQVWRELLGTEAFHAGRRVLQTITRASDWESFDRLFGRVLPIAQGKLRRKRLDRIPLSGIEVVQVKRFESGETDSLLGHSSVRIPRANDLDRIFEMRPVRVGASHPFVALSYLQALLTGLVDYADSESNRVRLIRLRHPEDGGNTFSYALFVPGYGSGLSNASEYWLLLRVATDFSGNGMQAKFFVDKLMETDKSRLEIRDYVVPYDQLEDYVQSRKLKRLRGRVDRFEAFLSSFRGALAELVVVELLRREGLRVISIRQHLKWLGGREVDIVAVREGSRRQLLLIECKARLDFPRRGRTGELYRSRPGLDRDFDDAVRFVSSVESRSNDWAPLCRDLGVHGPVSVVPVVAAVGNMDSRAIEFLGPSCEVWDWKGLKDRISRVGLDRSIWGPLERFAQDERATQGLHDLRSELFSDTDVSLNR